MKVKLEWTYRTKRGAEIEFTSDFVMAEEALMILEDIENTGRMKRATILDQHDTTWTVKELKNYFRSMETEPQHISVYFDGGFDIKTNKSGAGCAIYYKQNGKRHRLRKNALLEELDTNNEAEYAAFHLALLELEQMGVQHMTVTFIGDSQVVINQMNGEWPVYEKELSNWADRLEEKMNQLGITPEYQLVSRKQNKEADHLATQALQGIEITSTIELPGQ